MHKLVKIITDEDGFISLSDKWHYISEAGGSECCLCDGQVFGYGEGAAEYEMKEVQRGGVTCPHCIAIIKEHKAVKL